MSPTVRTLDGNSVLVCTACLEFPSCRPSPVIGDCSCPVFLPGSYASLNLLGAYLGWSGYDYSSVPSYDD